MSRTHLRRWLRTLRALQLRTYLRPAAPWRVSLDSMVEDVRSALPEAWADRVIERVDVFMRGESIDYPHDDGTHRLYARQDAFGDCLYVTLRDVVVSPHTGACWTPDRRHVFAQGAGSTIRTLRTRFGTVRDGRVDFAVASVSTRNPYHFLVEDAPNLIGARRFERTPAVIVAPDAPPFVLDAIRMILGPSTELIVSGHNVRCDRYAFATRHASRMRVRPAAARMVREFFLRDVPEALSDPKGGTRIYISRRDTNRRRVENEEEVERTLEGYGFEIVRLDRLSFREQIAACRGARVVVGLHGAGLTHMLWAQDGTTVIEILPLPRSVRNGCYPSMAFGVGHAYRQVSCRPSSTSPHGRVPLDELSVTIEGTLATS